MDFIRKMSELDLWYIPIIVLVVMLFLGFWTGFWRGWKAALYFLIWNLVGYVAMIITLSELYESTFKNLAEKLLNSVIDNLGQQAFDNAISLFKGWIILVVVLSFLSLWNLLAYIFYFLFRKRMLKHLKENKAAGKSNAGSRLLGGAFGIITALPTAASMMGASTIASNNSQVNKFVDKFTNVISLGKVNHISDDWDAIYGLVLSASSAQDLSNLFQGGSVNIDQINKDKDSITQLFNNPKSAQIASDVIKHQLSKQQVSSIDQSMIDAAIANSAQLDQLQGVFSGLTAEGIENLKTAIQANAALNVTLNLDTLIAKLTQK